MHSFHRKACALAALVLFTSPALSRGQTTSPAVPAGPPKPPAEAAQFDFWIGEWIFASATGGGRNHITKGYDGWVIHEDFNGDAKSNLKGMSVSVYNVATKKWQQTWVDNSGAYLDFTGGMDGDRMILSRQFTNASGQEIRQRMVFFNIGKDAFDWNWEASADGGKTWKTNWQIHYTRKK